SSWIARPARRARSKTRVSSGARRSTWTTSDSSRSSRHLARHGRRYSDGMTRVALAVDLGGTKIEAGLVDERGGVVAESRNRAPPGRRLTADARRAAVSTVVGRALEHLPHGTELVGAGIGSAGPVDLGRGTIHPVNLPEVAGFPLVDAVRD